MIIIHYKRHEKASARIDSCINVDISFWGKTMNHMPDASEIEMTFSVEGGAEDTLQDLVEMMGKRRFKKPIEFKFKIKEPNYEDEFEVMASPIFYRMPDTSKPETTMVLEVRYD